MKHMTIGEARPAVESEPRYQKGTFIVTEERRRMRAYRLLGVAIGLIACGYPQLLALIEAAIR